MQKLLPFALPALIFVVGGYWIGTETDREKARIDAEVAAYNRALWIEAAKETERLRPILAAEKKKTDANLKAIQDLIETDPAKANEILNRIEAQIGPLGGTAPVSRSSP